jgi:response regulator NasT
MTKADRQDKRLRVLLVDDSPERRASVEASLAGVGCEVIGYAAGTDNLVQRIQLADPDVVIIDIETPGRDTLDSLQCVQTTVPKPVVMFTQDDNGETISRATRAGVSAYVVDGISQKRVRPILDAAIERFAQFRNLSDELARTRAELSERKLIDQAKGILMKQRGMSEDEAYKALRNLAMSNNKRIVEIAEGLIAAAKLLI